MVARIAENEDDGLPCFEMVNPATGQAFRIWVDGRTEGFPEGFGVINRIPLHIKYAELRAISDAKAGMEF